MLKVLNDKHISNNDIIFKRILKIYMSLLVLVLLIPSSSAANINTSNKIVASGQSFDLNVSIDPLGTSIAGAQLDFAFNRSILRINSVTEGNFFKQSGASTFFNSGIINNSAGTAVNIFDAIIGKSNVTTQGTFIIINMTAIGSSGSSCLNFSNVKISNTTGYAVPIIVTNGTVRINSSPVLAAIGNKIIAEGQTLNFILSASNPNGGNLIFSASNLPSGASFNAASRTFLWTPGYTQSGSYPNVHFEVYDGFYSDYENITITVNDVNRAPILTLSPANGSTFNETDTILINITASDPDNDPLAYIIKIDGIQVSTAPGYYWITNYTSSGYHTIVASVTDGKATVIRNSTIYINNVYPRYDSNQNGIVDIGDLVIISQHFNENTGLQYPRYDVNMDGVVDIVDITITAQHFGEQT